MSGGATVVNLSADAIAIGPFFSAVESRTILRIRGSLTVGPDPNGTLANDDRARISIGVGVVSTDAAFLGATAMPDPDAETSFVWLWYWSSVLIFGSTFTQEMLTAGGSFIRVDVDSKGMRKIKSGQSLVYVVQYVDITGAPPVDINFGQTRVLTGC